MEEHNNAPLLAPLFQILFGILIFVSFSSHEMKAIDAEMNSAILFNPNLLDEEALVVIDVTTDEFAQETQWSLINANDYSVLFSSQTFSLLPNTQYLDSIKVNSTTCLRFIIEDSNNDGLSGIGKFKVYFNEELIIADVRFTDNYTHSFNCTEGLVCEEAIRILQGSELLKNEVNNWFVIRPIFDTYFSIRTISKCDTKLWLYDDCDKVHPTDQTGSILFNDDFIDKQAGFAQVFLQAGTYYYLRVGKETACSENSFVEIVDLKLKKGCLDPASCNFDPTANLDSGNCIYEDCHPDVIVDRDILLASIYLDSIDNDSECLIEEGCLQGYGKRDIIRFTTQIENIGDADYIIGEAQENSSLFSEDNCHQHWHYLGYAEYLIFDGAGSPQPVGFKNGFCALDYRCKEDESYKYSCEYMGISAGCFDTYDHDLLCQWVDVTDLPDGDYSLVVRVNYNRAPDIFGREESNYENNWAQVCINLNRSEGALKLVILEDCPIYEDCLGIQYGRAQVDCSGICGGAAHYGDVNMDGAVDIKDVEDYKMKMMDQSMDWTACLDLDADGEIRIYDLVLLEDCVINNNTNESDPLHTHCDFPKSILNYADSVYLELSDFNIEEGYIILSYSSNTDLLALDLSINGVIIDSVLPEREDIDIISMSANNQLSFIVKDENLGFAKSASVTPFIRIYYKDITENDVCISDVFSVVNLQKEKTINSYSTDCLSFNTTALYEDYNYASIAIYPNPTTDVLRLSGVGNVKYKSYYIANQQGEIVVAKQAENGKISTINISNLEPGIYLLYVLSDTHSFVKMIVKI